MMRLETHLYYNFWHLVSVEHVGDIAINVDSCHSEPLLDCDWNNKDC